MSRRASATPAERHPIEANAYRLRQWPLVPERYRTAPVLRAFSRMTIGPVTGRWFIQHTRLSAADAAELLAEVVQQQAIETIAFEVESHPDLVRSEAPVRPAARLPLREMVLAALFCWALASSGGGWQAANVFAGVLTEVGVAIPG
jgi:hypothetical protein